MRSVVLVLLTGLLACGDATAPDPRLLGTWTTPLEDLGSIDRSHVVRFHANGLMDDEMRFYRQGRLTESVLWIYEYEVRGDSLFTRLAAGANQDLREFSARFDRSRFDVDGGRLTITYPWYGPADEPITATAVFWRNACSGAASMLCM